MTRLVAIVGATASGKSALGLDLAESLGGEIINADALQAYRGFDIGTAKPGSAEIARAPHHLIDVLEPGERYSAGRFARLARCAVSEIEARGAVPLVVGGSGFYLRALLEGISPLPAPDPAVRRQLADDLERDGLPALRERLVEADPATAERLAPGDRQRILRALEVALSTGRTLSDWVARRPFGEQRLPAVKLGLTLPRRLLYDRIAVRIGRMVEAGWVEEVAHLLERGVDPSAPAFQAIGYRQIARHLLGESSLEQALEEALRATRRYAKRQLTWFRGDPEIHWISGGDRRRAFAEALDLFCRIGARWEHG